MKRFYIIAKTDPFSQNVMKTLESKLIEIGLIVDKYNPDLLIVCGGDGKVLRSIHYYMKQIDKIHVLSIMTGTLGFSCDFYPDELDELVANIKDKKYFIESLPLLKVTVNRSRRQPEIYYAVNEFRVENRIRTCEVEVYLNDQYFETFRGNGLIVSTPFGSTAYNRSIGGAIICPTIKAMQLTEIAGIHHNLYRSLNSPLILDNKTKMKFKIYEPVKCILGIDHKLLNNNYVSDINLELANKNVNFIHFKDITFFDRLKKSFLLDK